MNKEERNRIRSTIKECLTENGFEFENGVLGIVVDCGGCDFTFVRLIELINKNIEEWTYNELLDLKIDINLPYETVKFNF